MSVSALTTVAAVRSDRAPTKADLGKTAKEDPQADARASLTDLLVTAIPTELVAPYTAATAIIVGLIDEPTAAVPDPTQHEGWRWLFFVLLLAGTGGAIYQGARNKKRRSRRRTRVPKVEIAAGVVAAAGWGLALPESPLFPYLDGDNRAIAPLAAGFAAVVILLILGQRLTQKAD
jgi:uncharacterized membrane protein